MKQLPFIIVSMIALLALITACGNGLEEGPAAASESDTDSIDTAKPDTGNVIPCTTSIADNCTTIAAFAAPHEIVRGSHFTPPVTFVTMNSNVVVGTRTENGDITPVAITFEFDDVRNPEDTIENAAIAVLPSTETSRTVIAALSSPSRFASICETGYQHIAVFNGPNQYRFYGIPSSTQGESAPLEPISRFSLVSANRYGRAIYLKQRTLLDGSEYDRICLLGEGIICSDGNEWIEWLSPEAGFINDMGIISIDETPVYIAVGQNGLIGRYQNDIWDFSLSDLTQHDLQRLSVDLSTGRFTTVGANGVVINAGPNDPGALLCPITTGRFIGVDYLFSYGTFNILADDGTIMAGILNPDTNGHYCNFGFTSEAPPIEAIPNDNNYFVLTPRTLYGAESRPSLIID